jgi:hypothetical protein
MSEGEHNYHTNNKMSKDKINSGYKTPIYIEEPDYEVKSLNEGIEDLHINQRRISNNATPKNTSDVLENCISYDLFKRLEESSPIKSYITDSRRISEIQLLNCHDNETEEDCGFKQNNNPGGLPMNNGQMINLQNFGSKNFKLRANLMDNNKEEEYKSLLGRTPFSPEKRKNSVKDNLPIYNYYDGSTEYLSQSFINEYGDNYSFVKKNDVNSGNRNSNCGGVGNNNIRFLDNGNMMSPFGNGEVGNSMYGTDYNNFNNMNYPPVNYDNENFCYEGYADDNELYNQARAMNDQQSNQSNDDSYIVEMFGKRGWICDSCNNFNYESKFKLIFSKGKV